MQQEPSQPKKPDYDLTLKRLLLRAHDGFLALVAPGVTWRRELSPELPAGTRQADLVWEVERPDATLGILHIELQTKVEADIGERLAEYAIRLWRRDHMPVRSVVIFLRQVVGTPASPFGWDWLGEERQRYVFDVIRLWELPLEYVLETPYYDLWPLTGLMAGMTADVVLTVAQKIAATPLPRSERSELTELLVVLAGTRIARQALVNALRSSQMIEDILNDSSFVDVVRDLAFEKGEEKGKAEGKAEGKADGLRTSLQLVLETRFGSLDEALSAAIERADEGTLKEALIRAAKDSLDQVRAELGA